MNTNYSTIAEMRSWINKQISNVKDQLSRIDKTHIHYEWLTDRLEYLETWSKNYEDMTGKKIPKKRDRSNMKHYRQPRSF